MDAEVAIARNAVNLRYEDLPSEVVEITKRQILDVLGVIAGASTMGEGSKEIVNLLKESGAKGKSTIIGYGGRLPSWMAGFANGSMAHELDYDDFGGGHPGICTVPAAFAVAEEVGGIDGKEFITAVAMAVDLICRMEAAVSRSKDVSPLDFDWFRPMLLGYFSATAAAGRILGLNEGQMLDAFAHIYQQASGNNQFSYSRGSVFRAIRNGFSTKAGILSALMAQRGLPGSRDSLEGKAGFYNVYFRGAYERSYLTDELGKRFENTKVGFKAWPACRGVTHAPIDATLGILREHNIPHGDLEEISVSVREHMDYYVADLDARRRPRTVIDAKISIPFVLGVAAIRRNVVLKDFTPNGLADSAVLQMAKKVTMKIDPKLKDARLETMVEIKTKDGKRHSKGVDFAYGDFRKPLPKEDLFAKFRDCVSYSSKPISKDKVEKIINMASRLEEARDVSQIIRLLG